MAFVSVATNSVNNAAVAKKAVSTRRAGVAQVSRRARIVVMSAETDFEMALQEDLRVAKVCADGGCSIDAVQDVLRRLELRRQLLSTELNEVNNVMAQLANANMSKDRNAVADIVASIIKVFSKAEDSYPKVGLAPWTMDKPKKK